MDTLDTLVSSDTLDTLNTLVTLDTFNTFKILDTLDTLETYDTFDILDTFNILDTLDTSKLILDRKIVTVTNKKFELLGFSLRSEFRNCNSHANLSAVPLIYLL